VDGLLAVNNYKGNEAKKLLFNTFLVFLDIFYFPWTFFSIVGGLMECEVSCSFSLFLERKNASL